MIKTISKVLKYFFLGLLGFSLLMTLIFAFVKVYPDQGLEEASFSAEIEYDSSYYAMRFDSLNALYGNNKILLPGFELQSLIALSYFPDLKEADIRFTYEPALVPMASRPGFFAMFKNKSNWIYNIIISSESTEGMEPILMKYLSFNGQVGILAHELGHTVHYQNFNMLQMLKFGVLYLIDTEFRAKHERDTDALAVYRGAGGPLYDYAYFVRYDPSVVSKMGQNDYMDKFYMNDVEISELMQSLSMYQQQAGGEN
ncbi:MAG: hypothetical protein AAF502_24445 [Bacteroidota bacterium]